MDFFPKKKCSKQDFNCIRNLLAKSTLRASFLISTYLESIIKASNKVKKLKYHILLKRVKKD